jgi:carbon-monoxide dehydrogenase small subunit
MGVEEAAAMTGERIVLRVNGETVAVAVPPSKLLLDCLREDLRLTGTKRGCDDSSCGACTVLIDGTPMLSCTLLAASCVAGDGGEITTIEGMGDSVLSVSLQRAFGELGGAQCGYCTPGMVMAARAILDRNPEPSESEIREGLSGNICRCTGYVQIFAAVRAAIAAERQARKNGPAAPLPANPAERNAALARGPAGSGRD